MSIIEDDMLDSVSGGVEGKNYSPVQLMQAGVHVEGAGAGKVYTYTYSNGQKVTLTQAQACDMYDCFMIAGGIKLTDQQVRDLLNQS